MAKFKDKSECIATMYLVNKDKESVPVMELHSKLEWKAVVSETETAAILSGERGLLEVRVSNQHKRNTQKLLRHQKYQLLWLAVKNLFS